MPKPVIGITSDYNDGKPSYHTGYGYVDAVVAAGGVPLILPYRAELTDIPQVLDLLDGIVFSGGADLDPAGWGETLHPKATPIRPERERYERALLAAVELRRMPTLGICLGSQLMNVHRGGSLHQFIPEHNLPPHTPKLEHRKLEVDSRHAVSVEPGSLLARTLEATTLEINSAHKQAYHRIGRGLRVIATAPDGIPEALIDDSYPLYLGVQWHPERIQTEGTQINLFKLLVSIASNAR